MMDALVPAVAALEAQETMPLQLALKSAAAAANEGAKSTVGMLPRFGRATTLGERARAARDPGATSVALFVGSLSNAVDTLSSKAADR